MVRNLEHIGSFVRVGCALLAAVAIAWCAWAVDGDATSPAGARPGGEAAFVDPDGWSYCRGPSVSTTTFGEDGELWLGPVGVRPNPGAPSHPREFTLCLGATRDVDLEGLVPVGPAFRFMPQLMAPPEGYPPYVLLRLTAADLPEGCTMDDVDVAVRSWGGIHPRGREPSWFVLGQIRFLGPPGVGEFALGYWGRANWAQPVVSTDTCPAAAGE
jgi:hypothetical protein